MNQRPTSLNVTKAITGFLLYKNAEGLAPVTVPGYERDKAILLTLLDTGLQAVELCALHVGDIDMKTGKVRIHPVKLARQRVEKGGLYIWESPRGDFCGATLPTARIVMIRMPRFFWASSIGRSTRMH